MKSSAVSLLCLAKLALVVSIGFAVYLGSETNHFKGKFKKIQLDMTEDQVDEIVVGHPMDCRNDLCEIDRKVKAPPDGPCTRTPLFLKIYSEKPDGTEGDYLIFVYFDDNYLVVHKEYNLIIK
jgi:hypothetical protein